MTQNLSLSKKYPVSGKLKNQNDSKINRAADILALPKSSV
jgi:hypothetical protein